MTIFATGRTTGSAAAAFGLILAATTVAAATAKADDGGLTINMITEIAGADETDVATPQELKRADTPMIPAHPDPNPPPTSFPPPREHPTAKAAPSSEQKAPAAAAAKEQQKTAPAMTPGEPTVEDESAMASATGIYLRGDAGYSLAQDPDGRTAAGSLGNVSAGNAAVVRAGVGYRLSPAFRLELNGGYRSNGDIEATDTAGRTTKTKVDAVTAMVAGYLDITTLGDYLGHGWMPYLGAGVGWARLSTDNRSVSGGQPSEGGAASNNLTYAVMAGMAAPLADRLTLDLGYRFQNLGGFENSGGLSDGSSQSATTWDDLLVHEVSLGLRYAF